MKRGRPSKYTEELADAICTRLAQGESMRSVCRDEDMPVMDTMWRWIREKEGFSEQYARAKQECADALVEEMMDIADDGSNDWMDRMNPDSPGYQLNGESIQRSRLRVDTRKWVASKLKPKKYGDKIDVDANVEGIIKVKIGGNADTGA